MGAWLQGNRYPVIFQSRRSAFSSVPADHLAHHRDQLKETVIWNAEAGLAMSAFELGQAEVKRTAYFQRVGTFMTEYDFLVCPVTQVPAFDVTQEYVTEINGTPMETYIDWMKSCYYISALGLPAISVPCGFTDDGLPVGIQIVGRLNDDLSVLQLAHAFEYATAHWRTLPNLL